MNRTERPYVEAGMRLLALGILGLMLVSSPASARCMAGSVSLLPEGGALPVNGRIVLSGEGRSAAWVAALEHAWLVSSVDRVRVRSGEHLHGASEQVLLLPERPLQPGQTYRLSAGPARADDRYTLEHVAWTVVAADESTPSWDAPPAVASVTRVEMGCGNAEHVRIRTALKDGGAAQLLVRASIEGAGTTALFWVPVREGSIALGRGMCGGEWIPREGESYTVSLTALDAAGHAAATPAPLGVTVRFDEVDAGTEPEAGGVDAGPPALTDAGFTSAASPRAPSCSTGSPCGAPAGGQALVVLAAVIGAVGRRRRRSRFPMPPLS